MPKSPDRPLEWWEEIQVEMLKTIGLPEDAEFYRNHPEKWREMREQLRRCESPKCLTLESSCFLEKLGGVITSLEDKKCHEIAQKFSDLLEVAMDKEKEASQRDTAPGSPEAV